MQSQPGCRWLWNDTQAGYNPDSDIGLSRSFRSIEAIDGRTMMDGGAKDASHEGGIARRRRIVREFLRALHEAPDDLKRFYSFESLLGQITMKEVCWTLVETLEDEDLDMRMVAGMVLLQVEDHVSEASGMFLEILASDDAVLSFRAAVLLSNCNQVPAAVAPALLTMFRSQNWFCRVAAACALIERHPEVAPVLIQALRTDNPSAVDKAAAEWTSGQGRIDRVVLGDAKGVMTSMLQDLAACALGRRGAGCPEPVRAEAVRVLVKGLRDGEQSVKLCNAYLLLRMGEQAADALDPLVTLLGSRETGTDLRRAVASVIGKIGGATAAGKALVRPLLRALKSTDWVTACNIVASLEAIGESPRGAILAMVRLATTAEDAMARRMAAQSFGKFGPAAAEFIPALIGHARQERNRDVWMSIANAIVAIGPPAIPCLIDALAQGGISDIALVSETLSRMGEAAVEALAQTMLTHHDGLVRRHAAALMRLIGPRAAAAVPVAMQLLKSGDADQRLDALIALGAMGPVAAAAAFDIANALSDRNPDIREWAKNALEAIGPDARPALERVFPDADKAAQGAIADLLRRWGERPGPRTDVPDFGWVGDDEALELLVSLAKICERTGIRSVRGAAREMGRMRCRGEIADHLLVKYGRIKASLDKLERLLSLKEGRAVRLMGAQSTRPEGITAEGRRYFREFRDYLDRKKPGGPSASP
jgi:HEAT repeat protein